MKKSNVVEQFAKSIFESPNFREKWEGYLTVFGNDIAEMFPDSYKARVSLAAILQKICDKNFDEAKRELTPFLNSARTDSEKDVLSRLIDLCAKNIPEPTYLKMSERYMRFRGILFENAFSEASKCTGHFFRQATEKTAFVINLYDEDCALCVMYGFASTAITAMAGCENEFAESGSDKDSCQVRNIIRISGDGDEASARSLISDFYEQYKDFQKDAISEVKKERQKNFLAFFALPLKKLGFKKKGTKWTKILDDENALSFEAQKSAFSDQYYFNVSIHSPSDFYARSSFERVVLGGTQIYNWQLMSEKEIRDLVEYSIKNFIEPKLT